MNYYGLDWLAMKGNLLALYLISQKSRKGFAVFVGANLVWLMVAILAHSPAIFVGNSAFLTLNVQGVPGVGGKRITGEED